MYFLAGLIFHGPDHSQMPVGQPCPTYPHNGLCWPEGKTHMRSLPDGPSLRSTKAGSKEFPEGIPRKQLKKYEEIAGGGGQSVSGHDQPPGHASSFLLVRCLAQR